ncbi:MAG: hypothetical protein WKF78_09320 [Candidatus Limnocylindrales bacterium]
MPAGDVTVLILHPEPGPAAGPLVLAVAAARAALAERHVAGFRAAGATDVRVVAGPPDDTPFGARLRGLVRQLTPDGLVVLGSGAVPLTTAADRLEFVRAAAQSPPGALVNNRYSADIVAISRATEVLAELPDLPTDNALPRWLAEAAGITVDDLRGRWRLALDIDGPLELVLLGGRWAAVLDAPDRKVVVDAVTAVRAVAADPRAELLVAGRTSVASLAWLERGLPPGRERSWKNAACARASPVSAHLPPCWASCWIATDPPPWAGTWFAWPTLRSSTRASSSPTASGRTNAPGRQPRTASRPTCSCPGKSQIRGCANLPRPPWTRRSPCCWAATRSSGQGSGSPSDHERELDGAGDRAPSGGRSGSRGDRQRSGP